MATCRGNRFSFWNPPGVGWVNFLGESQSRIYPNMCATFGCGPMVVSKKGGTDRQTDSQTDRQAGRQTDRQTDRQTKVHCSCA